MQLIALEKSIVVRMEMSELTTLTECSQEDEISGWNHEDVQTTQVVCRLSCEHNTLNNTSAECALPSKTT